MLVSDTLLAVCIWRGRNFYLCCCHWCYMCGNATRNRDTGSWYYIGTTLIGFFFIWYENKFNHLKWMINENNIYILLFSLISAKSLPVHCVVEAIHSIVETRPIHTRENWRRPHVEMDTYVFIPANMPFQVIKFFFLNVNFILRFLYTFF